MPTIAVDRISIGTNRRPVKDQKVLELIESIKVHGLLNPITLDENLHLVAGLHRLIACKLLGFQQIDCHVIHCQNVDYARLAEIDENLIRSELEVLERAELWLERDQILEQLGARARSGDNQYTKKGSATVSPPPKTTLELAQEAGYSKRTFQQGKQIAGAIAPEVKQKIRGTAVARSSRQLLKIARAGSEERQQAEAAEKTARLIQAEDPREAERQLQLADAARAKQIELQLETLESLSLMQESKLLTHQHSPTQSSKTAARSSTAPIPNSISPGTEWLLDNHLVYYGDTTDSSFIQRLPSHAALAIAAPAQPWSYDYLVHEARVVAVIQQPGSIHDFCNSHRMPFRFEWIVSNLYVALFSRELLRVPQISTDVNGVAGIITYLINLYTSPGSYVIAPSLGQGEVLVACEQMGRTCFAGDQDLEHIRGAINRWEQHTGKPARLMSLLEHQ